MLAQDVDLGLGETELGVRDGGGKDGCHGYICSLFSHGSTRRVPAEKSHSGKGSPGVDYVDLVLGRQRILGSARGKLVKLGPGHCQGGSSE